MIVALTCPAAGTAAACAAVFCPLARLTSWDDFFGPEVYADSSLWAKFMTEKQQLLLSCHLYSCS
jgi:hypothetical protein